MKITQKVVHFYLFVVAWLSPRNFCIQLLLFDQSFSWGSVTQHFCSFSKTCCHSTQYFTYIAPSLPNQIDLMGLFDWCAAWTPLRVQKQYQERTGASLRPVSYGTCCCSVPHSHTHTHWLTPSICHSFSILPALWRRAKPTSGSLLSKFKSCAAFVTTTRIRTY
jgi:hypothetical protein